MWRVPSSPQLTRKVATDPRSLGFTDCGFVKASVQPSTSTTSPSYVPRCRLMLEGKYWRGPSSPYEREMTFTHPTGVWAYTSNFTNAVWCVSSTGYGLTL